MPKDGSDRMTGGQGLGGRIHCRFRSSQSAEALPIAQGAGPVGAAQAGLLQIDIDLGVGDEGQVLDGLGFEEDASVVGDKEPDFAGVANGAKAQLLQDGSFGQARDISGSDDRFGVGVAKPTGDPLGESDWHRLLIGPRLELAGGFE